ncbi:MAG: hypothetical protein ACP5NL_01160 [Thermoplasmata archaeon]
MKSIVSQLTKLEFKSIFRNKHNIMWGIGYIVIWIFIYNFAFPAPPQGYKVEYLASYVSFVVLLAGSIAVTTTAYRVANDALPHIYLYRSTNASLYVLIISILVPVFIFGVMISTLSFIVGYLVFGYSYGIFPAVNITILLIALIEVTFFYISFGSFISYILLNLKSIKLIRYITMIPLILVLGLILGLQVTRSPTLELLYISPFNAIYSAFELSITGSSSKLFNNLAIKNFYLLLSPILWAVILLILSIVFYGIYYLSSAKNEFKLEDLYG